MKKLIFATLALAVAVLTTQTAYGMKRKDKPEDRRIPVVVDKNPVIIKTKSPDWLNRIDVNPKKREVRMYVTFTDGRCNRYEDGAKTIKELLVEIQKQVKFTKVFFDNKNGCLKTCHPHFENVMNAVFDSSKNIVFYHYFSRLRGNVYFKNRVKITDDDSDDSDY